MMCDYPQICLGTIMNINSIVNIENDKNWPYLVHNAVIVLVWIEL